MLRQECRSHALTGSVGTLILLASLIAPFDPPGTMTRAYIWMVPLAIRPMDRILIRW
jgi:hypothetical protein